MQRLARYLTTVAVVASLSVLSFGPISGPAPRTVAAPLTANARTLIVARDLSDAKTMDPQRCYEFSCAAMASNVYDSLVVFKGTDVAHPRPSLATSWKVTNGGRVFTFKLRHGVRFSSGNPLTAADVVFSFRRLGYLNDNPAFLIAPSGPSSTYALKAVDKYTVRITLPTPDASFLSALATPFMGIVDSKVAKQHGGLDTPDAATKDQASTYLNEHSAGSGAFVFTNWTRGASGQIVVKRNPRYWGKKPSLDKIIWNGVTNATTQRLEVSRGTVDVAENIDIDGARTLQHDRNVKVVTGNTLDLVYMGMTLSCDVSKPLCNPKVRQAVRYAIDYQGIIKGLLSGIGTQPNSMIPVGLAGNDPAYNKKAVIRQNLSKARSLLKQAGYPDGFSETLNYAGGVTFDGVSYDLLAPKIQQDLAKVGIKVKLNPTQQTVLLAAYRAQKLSMILFNWGVDYPDSNDFAGPFSAGGLVGKRMWYMENASLAKLVQKAITVSQPAKRAAAYREIQQTWLKESPWIAVVQPKAIVVFHRGVTGYKYSPVYSGDFRFLKKA